MWSFPQDRPNLWVLSGRCRPGLLQGWDGLLGRGCGSRELAPRGHVLQQLPVRHAQVCLQGSLSDVRLCGLRKWNKKRSWEVGFSHVDTTNLRGCGGSSPLFSESAGGTEA